MRPAEITIDHLLAFFWVFAIPAIALHSWFALPECEHCGSRNTEPTFNNEVRICNGCTEIFKVEDGCRD